MTTVQINAEIQRNLSTIADDVALMGKVLKYVKKLAATKEDPTLMTKDEFYSRLDEAEAQYARGEYSTQLPGESVTEMLRRCWYL